MWWQLTHPAFCKLFQVCVCVCLSVGMHKHRVQQLEDENGEMKLNVCRLKSQTEKLDQVSVTTNEGE